MTGLTTAHASCMYTFHITERRLDGGLEQSTYGFEDLESFLTFYRPEFNRIDDIKAGHKIAESANSTYDADLALHGLKREMRHLTATLIPHVRCYSELHDFPFAEMLSARRQVDAAVGLGASHCERLAAEFRRRRQQLEEPPSD